MKTPRYIASLCVFLSLAACSHAASIVWVSDMMPIGSSTSDRDGGTDGIFGAGAGAYPDQGLVNLLTGAGHTVTRFNPSNTTALSQAHIDQLNGHDLIIFGRSLGSANLDAAKSAAWNTLITTPIISTNSYLSRSTHLGWFTGATLPDQVSNPLTFNNLADPATSFIVGSTSITGSTMNNSYTYAITYPNGVEDIRGTSVLTSPPVAGAIPIATAPVGDATGYYIVAFPEGTTLNNGQQLAGYRLHFLVGNRESATAGDAPVSNVVGSAGFNNLTAEGEGMFLRAVELALNEGVVVPEPTSATLVLLAGSILLRRRRAA